MELIGQLGAISIFGNIYTAWAKAAVAVIFTMLALRIFQGVILVRLGTLTERHRLFWPGYVLTALKQTKFLLIFIIALRVGSVFLTLPADITHMLSVAAIIAFFVQCGIWLSALYAAWYGAYREHHIKANAAAVTTLDATKVLVRLFIWVCILLVILNNLGFNISALITGLGVGGVAIALAVQKILGDILASLAIVTDKPFAVGDFLALEAYMGSVEHIGLKTTRLRSLAGEQIIFSNSDLLSSRIRNYGRMYERRLEETIGLTYQTPRDMIEKIPGIIKDAVLAQEKTRFDRAHFKGFGQSSLDFSYVYFVTTPDFNLYMDIQQAINLTLHRRFEEEGVEFAFPTRTLIMQSPDKI